MVMRKEQRKRERITRAHLIGKSMAVTLDPNLVRRFGIGNTTFMVQRAFQGGILLELRELHSRQEAEGTEDIPSTLTATVKTKTIEMNNTKCL
jgi:hypothetical protein